MSFPRRFIHQCSMGVLVLATMLGLAVPKALSGPLFDINIFRYNQNSIYGGFVGTVPGGQAIPMGLVPLINAQIYAAMAPVGLGIGFPGIAGIGFPGIAGIGYPGVGVAGIGFPGLGIVGIGFPGVGIGFPAAGIGIPPVGIGLGFAGVPGYGIGVGMAGVPGLGVDPYLYGGMTPGLYGAGSYAATVAALTRSRLAMSMPMNYLAASYGMPMAMPVSYGALGVPAVGFPGGSFGGFPVGGLMPSLAFASFPQAGFGFPGMYGGFPLVGYSMPGYMDPWMSGGYSPDGYPYSMPTYSGYPSAGYLPMGYGGY